MTPARWTDDLERRVAEARERNPVADLEVLLMDHGYPTNRSIAMELGETEVNVSLCMSGVGKPRTPTMSRIRDDIARLACIDHAAVDQLLGGAID